MFDGKAIALIFLFQLLGYLVKGLVGFGNPLISTPLLSMILDSSIIPPGAVILDAPVNAVIAWQNRRDIRWRRIAPLLAAVLCGVVPGVLLLKIPFQRLFKILLGLLVLGLGLEMAGRRKAGGKAGGDEGSPWVRCAVAFASGVCAGLFGINMLIVAYLKRTSRNYDEFKGSICFLFLAENLFRSGVYLAAGLITRQVLTLAALTVPAAVLGVGIGAAAGRKLPEEKLNACAIVMFLLSGASILIKAVFFGA